MTDYRAPNDPYTTTFEADVTRLAGRNVVLDHTYFYAEGGGQPADRGTIGCLPVVDVRKEGAEIVHTCNQEPEFVRGARVDCHIDHEFRTYCMRVHTASHALYGAGRQLLSNIGYGGFGIDPEKARIDFETSSTIDDEVMVEMERLVNRVVWDSREVTWETYPEDKALALDGIAFNAKTEEGITGDTVRVVTIEGESGAPWDIAACGGTHVSNTREIGPVTVLDRSNPGAGLTRVEITVGPPAIDQRAIERQALLDAAGTIGTAPSDLPGEITRLQQTIAEQDERIESLRNRLAEAQVRELKDEIVEKNGARWLVGEISGLNSNALGDLARDTVGGHAEVVAFVRQAEQTFLTVASTAEDAEEIVTVVTEKFGGGGGGSPGFAQAGGIPAPPDDVIRFLRG